MSTSRQDPRFQHGSQDMLCPRTQADEASVSPHWLSVSEGTEAAALQGEGSHRLLGAPLRRGLWEAAPVTFLMIFRP